jgi:hypothetical protein
VGLSCEGFEKELVALFIGIEASCNNKVPVRSPNSHSKLVNGGNDELKTLSCSINYDFKGGYSSTGRGKDP